MISKKDHHALVRIVQEIKADELPIDKVVERFGGSSVVTVEDARAIFEDARVFEISTDAYEKLWFESHEQLLSSIKGVLSSNHPPEEAQQLLSNFQADMVKDLPADYEKSEAGSKFRTVYDEVLAWTADIEFPRDLPFDANLFLVAGDLLLLPDIVLRDYDIEPDGGSHLGMLVTHDRVFEVILEHGSEGKAIHMVTLRSDGEWVKNEVDFKILLTTALLRICSEHDQHITRSERDQAEKKLLARINEETKKEIPIPPAFYQINLTTAYVEQEKKNIFPKPRLWSHRWDVMGNQAVRYHVGPLPIDEKTKRKLKKRGYKFFLPGQPFDEETAKIAAPREIQPPKDDEWLAILTWWREAHIRGPEDKPHVPASRQIRLV